MRPIPASITDEKIKAKLESIAQKIDEKMKQVEVLKSKIKSGKMTPNDLASLKEISSSIDALDKEWKQLT